MNIKIEKEKRRTIVLKLIDKENLLVKAPIFITKSKIQEFIYSKRNWIARAIQKFERKQQFSSMFDLENNIYINGKCVGKVDDLIKSKAKNRLKAFYLKQFSSLEELAKSISERIGLGYKEIKSCNSVRVWGSYSAKGVMKLNWKLVLLPQHLIEYVIIHELCHGRHMNHSLKFWLLVEKYCENYKRYKKEIENYSFVLTNDFCA